MNSDFRVYLTAYHSEVTGSRLLLNAIYPDGRKVKILIDCGYYQEIEYRYLNYERELRPEDVDAILITHNHIDHTGLLPRMVKEGYRGPIYMTNITKELLPGFLMDSAEHQDENAEYLRRKYPSDAHKFEALYDESDVEATLKLCEGVEYDDTIEILPGVRVTFTWNGHILGASCILVQFLCYGRKTTNFLFTGDYRARNPLVYIPGIPKWIRKLELIVVCESTYGSIERAKIRTCFNDNMEEAFKKRRHVLIGAFAQGRMQEILARLKAMQKEGIIPDDYEICIDGGLGISTCHKYSDIMRRYFPNSEDFIPDNLRILDAKTRSTILDEPSKTRKILVTTSGMLSNGPAKEHVPVFLERFDCMIHLCGYAAEETVARKLLETIRLTEVQLGDKIYQKNAVVKTTREFTSHATSDELICFLKKFPRIRFLAVNHGATEESEGFMELVGRECQNVEEIGRLNRQTMFCFTQKAPSGAKYSNIVVKSMPAKLRLPLRLGWKSDIEKQRRHRKTSRDTADRLGRRR